MTISAVTTIADKEVLGVPRLRKEGLQHTTLVRGALDLLYRPLLPMLLRDVSLKRLAVAAKEGRAKKASKACA